VIEMAREEVSAVLEEEISEITIEEDSKSKSSNFLFFI